MCCSAFASLCTSRFGPQAQNRIVQWLERNVDKVAAVVDIGCGNGALLVTLVRSHHSGEIDTWVVCLPGCVTEPSTAVWCTGPVLVFSHLRLFRLKGDL